MKEEWKVVPEFPKYEVSNKGRLRSSIGFRGSDDGIVKMIWPPAYQGYVIASVFEKGKRFQISVHRLVLFAFIGPCPEGMEVNHIDGNPGNNNLENLEYVTHQQNMQHAIRLGLRNTAKGKRVWNCKLTNADIKDIRLMASNGVVFRHIKEKYKKVSPGHLHKVIGKRVRTK